LEATLLQTWLPAFSVAQLTEIRFACWFLQKHSHFDPPEKSHLLFFALLLTTLALEAALGLVFWIKDRNLEPMSVRDYPYAF